MNSEVKKYADNNDIKGLKYIFVDCLDVDPTFEKYKEEYDYCKAIPGFLEQHKELTPFKSDETVWTGEYWGKLKTDWIKNSSEKRFIHMREVAQVLQADKIKRLKKERLLIGRELENQQTLGSTTINIPNSQNVSSNKTTKGNTTQQKIKDQADREAIRLHNEKVDADREAIRLHNEKVDADIDAQNKRLAEEREKHKQEELRRKERNRERGTQSKKGIGIAPILVVGIILSIMLLILLLQ